MRFIEILKRRAAELKSAPQTARAAVHEFITLKDSFFYWAAQHIDEDSAFLDSTIVPDEEVSPEEGPLFDSFAGFSASFNEMMGVHTPDPWLTLVKENEKANAKERFNTYFKEVEGRMNAAGLLDVAGEIKPREKEVHDEICNPFALGCKQARQLTVKERGSHARCVAGIVKTYLNTHRLEKRAQNRSPKLAPADQHWVNTRHWIFRYYLSDDTQSIAYFIEQGSVSPDKPLPYSASKSTEAKQYISLERLARRELDELSSLLKRTQREVNAAKTCVHYDEWEGDDCYSKNESNSTYKWQAELHSNTKYAHLGLDNMDNGKWQQLIHCILFGKTTVERETSRRATRAKQYGMLLAFSAKGDALEKAASCSTPRPVIVSYLQYKLKNLSLDFPERFFETLNLLCNFILRRRGCKTVDLSTLERCAETLTKQYQHSWTTPYFKIIKLLLKIMSEEGLLREANKAKFQKVMYGQIGDIRSFFTFFSSSSQQKMRNGISLELDRCIDLHVDTEAALAGEKGAELS